ncbi:MAG: DUF2480 family protein [Cyclobacteriaceae bacterium]
MSEEIKNRVADAGLITFDLEDFYKEGERVVFDIKPLLEQELILREKPFREFVKSNDWSGFSEKHVAIFCSLDAIVPVWAYMLLVAALEPYAKTIVYGDLDKLEEKLFLNSLATVDWTAYSGTRVFVKGCSKARVPEGVFVEVTARLKPFVSGLMFGEPCSAVPVFKKK